MECASMLNKKSSANSYSEESLPSEVCTFPPEKRILKSDEFGRVFKTGNHRIRQDSLHNTGQFGVVDVDIETLNYDLNQLKKSISKLKIIESGK